MSFFVRLWVSAIIKLLALFGFVALWLVASEQSSLYATQVRQTVGTLRATDQLIGSLIDAENNMHAYLISGGPHAQKRLVASIGDVKTDVARLKSASLTAVQTSDRLAALEPNVRELLNHYDEIVAVSRTSGLAVASELDRGADHKHTIRAILHSIQAEQESRLAIHEAAWQRSQNRMRTLQYLLVPIVALTLITLTVHATRLMRRSINVLIEGVEAVGHTNDPKEIELPSRDEFGRLAVAFNRMIGRLKTAHRARQEAEQNLAYINAELAAQTKALEERTRTMGLISRMSHRLPGCDSEAELVNVVECFIPRVLPGIAGALYLTSPGDKCLRMAAQWNSMAGSLPEFSHDSCWALRRGQEHHVGASEHDVMCHHIDPSATRAYICIPLVAHGETVGLLYFESAQNGSMDWTDRMDDLQVIAERLSLGLINLRLKETLRSQSMRDPLTGLFNRRHLNETLPQELSKASRQNRHVGVIMLDVDHFKQLNDTRGHDYGDKVLQTIATTIQQHIRSEDIAFRFGGEEFLIVLPGADEDIASARAEILRQALHSLTIRDESADMTITASFGVAAFPTSGLTWQSVIRAADQALYRAKRDGRDQVVPASRLTRAAA